MTSRNTILVENKKGATKEFRLLLKIEGANNKKYYIYTDDKELIDGSLHTFVSVLGKTNRVLKSAPTTKEMKYIESLLMSLCRE